MNFVKELEWRGMIHNIMPGTEELFTRETVTAYVGIDPTADSLHIGHLVSIMMLKHLQVCGHRPIVVLGGATGMVGDPSGKSNERNLLDEETLMHNEACIRKQVSRFLDFSDSVNNSALLLNNYHWTKDYSFLGFVRDIGKHITVNYMMAKDSVKKRLSGDTGAGMSFTEFSYQLLQGFDFLHLFREYGCKLQMGGSDQWGNITTGTELIRRICQSEAFALTCPLITKADGGKFGKTEDGNVWLDPERTSPYKFYQFWLNISDEDAEKYIRIFTLLQQQEIEELTAAHRNEPHLRLLQKKLAEQITCMVHSTEEYNTAVAASEILFGKGTADQLASLDEKTILAVFEGVPVFEVAKSEFENGIALMQLLTENAPVFPSKGELRRSIQGNGLSINKQKYTDVNGIIHVDSLISGKFIVVQKGKKDYYLIVAK
ncbi:MAG TPA: tyrosine--tRNA ligase [Bacteroidales bacterium]|nr:tyrosine--tRNA ligase [Bacteroidales bacterium]